MRIVIDMQGAQTASRFRGIGRYTLGFAQAVVRHRGEHEVILVLNGLLADNIQLIRNQFADLLPSQNILVWHGVGPVAAGMQGNHVRRDVAELSREHFLVQLDPDVLHICSLFEGYGDDAVGSIGRVPSDMIVSVTLHDLIPLVNPKQYFYGKDRFRGYYFSKFDYLKRASCFLAVSEYSRQEGIQYLALPDDRFFCTFEAIEDRFSPAELSENGISPQICDRLGIMPAYILYTGGADERKNLPRLLEAYALLPAEHRRRYQLVLAGKIVREEMEILNRTKRELGLDSDRIIFTGYVSDEDLIELYRHCALFVFPSWHEGFGLPALEAMSCGAPVIAANTASLPEIVGNSAALFDPLNTHSISDKMRTVLDDRELRSQLRLRGLAHVRKFSWDETARRAIDAWENTLARSRQSTSTVRQVVPEILKAIAPRTYGFTDDELVQLSASIARNQHSARVRTLAIEVSSLWGKTGALDRLGQVWSDFFERIQQSALRDWNTLSVVWSPEDARYQVFGVDPSQAVEMLWVQGDVLLTCPPVATDQLDRWGDTIRQIRDRGVTVLAGIDEEAAANLAAQHDQLGPRWVEACSAILCSAPSVRDHISKFSLVDDVSRRSGWPAMVDTPVDQGATADAEPGLRSLLQQVGHRPHQLLVDVSELVQRDARSGIQRVVRSVLLEWLQHPPADFRVEPVYATPDGPYRYARRFTHAFLESPGLPLGEDDPIEYSAGDVFFGLDMQPQVAPAHKGTYQSMRRNGVKVSFLVHDLLCLQMPQYFGSGAAETFERWLAVVSESDGAICVSRTVAEDLQKWIIEKNPARLDDFKIDWSHNGADIFQSKPTIGLPPDADSVLDALKRRPSFLMVGTLEPRKGHQQVLAAFESLWKSETDVNLAIVGKIGWMVEDLVDKIKKHPENYRRLFWIADASDEYLNSIYKECACLIAASWGEGFGLPLIEAAQRGLPIISRDLPVFREVAGDSALYFCGSHPKHITQAIQKWLLLRETADYPEVDKLQYLTWPESARRTLQKLIGDNNANYR